MPHNFSFMCLDLRRTAFLAWSYARARALQEQTRIEWEPYRGSKVLNAIYGVLFWKEGPGTAEIRQDQKKIDALTNGYFNHTFDTFLEKSFTLGPVGLAHYADELVATRDYAFQSVQEMFHDASSINAEVAGEAQRAIETLAKIKLASTLTLTATSCILTLGGSGAALTVGYTKLGYDVLCQTIKPHDHVGENVKGVAYETGKYAGEKGADKLAEHAGEIGEHGLKQYGPKLLSAEQRIERYSKELARRFRSGKVKKIARRLDNATADRAAATRGLVGAERTVKAAKVAGKAVPLVFAAWDVIDAYHEYREDIGAGE